MLEVLDKASKELGYKIKVTSAYRSYLSQVILALKEISDAAIDKDWDQHSRGAVDIALGNSSREALAGAYKAFDVILGNQGTIIVYGDGHMHIYPLGERIRMEIGIEGIIPLEEQRIYPFTAFKHISEPVKFGGIIDQKYYADRIENGLVPVNLKESPYWILNIAKGRVFPESWTTRTDEGRRALKPNYARLLHVVQEALRFNAKGLVSYEEIPSLMAIIDWVKIYETQYGSFGKDDALDLIAQITVSLLSHNIEETLPVKPATTGGSYEMAYKTAVRLLKDRKQTPDSIWNEIFNGVSRDISDKELLDMVQKLFVLPDGAQAVGLPKIAEAVFAPDGQKALLCDWLITAYILNNVEALKGFCNRIGLEWGGLNNDKVRVFAVSTNLGWDSIFREGLKRNLKELQDIAKGDYSLEIKAEAARIAEKLDKKLNRISGLNAKMVEAFYKSPDGQRMKSLLTLIGKSIHLSGGTRNINIVKDINNQLGFRVDLTKLRSDIIKLLFQAKTKEEIMGILDIINRIDGGAPSSNRHQTNNNTSSSLPPLIPGSTNGTSGNGAPGASSSMGGSDKTTRPAFVGSVIGSLTSSSLSAAGGVNTTNEGIASSSMRGSVLGAGGIFMANAIGAIAVRLQNISAQTYRKVRVLLDAVSKVLRTFGAVVVNKTTTERTSGSPTAEKRTTYRGIDYRGKSSRPECVY